MQERLHKSSLPSSDNEGQTRHDGLSYVDLLNEDDEIIGGAFLTDDELEEARINEGSR